MSYYYKAKPIDNSTDFTVPKIVNYTYTSTSNVCLTASTEMNFPPQLVHMPYGSISNALSTYSGQNYGARNTERVKQGLKHGMFLSAIISVTMMLVFQLLSRPIMQMFVQEEAVILIGSRGLRVTSFFYISLGAIYMSRGILNGVGDAMFAFINGIVEVACRLCIPMVLTAVFPQIDQIAIWWTTCLTWTGGAIFCLLRYYFWCRKADFSKLDE